MQSLVAKRSIVIAGHKTSVSLEEPFWTMLKEIAHRQSTTLSMLVGGLDHNRKNGNLSSVIRLFVLDQAVRASNESREAFSLATGVLGRPALNVAA